MQTRPRRRAAAAAAAHKPEDGETLMVPPRRVDRLCKRRRLRGEAAKEGA